MRETSNMNKKNKSKTKVSGRNASGKSTGKPAVKSLKEPKTISAGKTNKSKTTVTDKRKTNGKVTGKQVSKSPKESKTVSVKKINKAPLKVKNNKTAKPKSSEKALITFTIDGIECKGRAGQTIVEASKDNGIYIPTLCNYEGLVPAGICRICTVKVGGRNMAACTTPIAEGMIIDNNIPDLEDRRKALIEMLFVEGNHLCPVCEKSGNCQLQALGYRYKILVPRFPYQFPPRSVDAAYTKIMIDTNRCVQCRRCIRGITARDGQHVFAMTRRSGKSTIIADRELEAKLTDETARKAMDQCPVGAILKKEIGFAVPIGKRKYDKAPIGSEVESNITMEDKQ